MKLRDWTTSLTALLVVASGGVASAKPTLRMRPVRTAQAAPAPVPDAQPPDAQPAADPAAPAPAAPVSDAPPPIVDPGTEPVSAEPTPPTEGEVIVVTGSRIGDPLGKAAPVLSLSRQDLERTGLTSVGDILQQLPVSGGAINGKFNSSGNFGSPPDGGGIGAGATEADLRYLGSKRVLILVDGVRWVNGSSASGIAAGTDLNTIPLGIVERVEVLEDGASPIYGSDAIAGVINIITRKEFTGAMANAYVGGFSAGDGFLQKYDVSWGASTPKTSMVVSASFLDQRTIFSKDRDISKTVTPNTTDCGNCSSATPQGWVRYNDPVTGDRQNLTLNNGVGTPMFPNDYHSVDDVDRFNFAPYNLVQTPSQRMNVFTTVTHKVRPDITIRGKASFTNRQSVNQAAPEPLFVGPSGASGTRMDTLSIDVTNPYNPFGFTFDPSDPYVVTRRPVEAGPRKFEQNVNTFYASGGLDGHFDVDKSRFNWDATIAYGLNRGEQRRNNSFNSVKLANALGPAYLGSDGNYHCGTAANPGDANCVPFNIFGGQGPDGRGTITPAMLAYTTFTEHDVSEQSTVDALANLTGNLVKLPAGYLAAAIGVEHRRLKGFFEPDAVVAAGDSADIPATPTSGDYYVSEAYAELRAPIVAGVAGAELLDINAAARVSDYSFLKPELTGKIGARWKPTKDLIVRGSYGRGFRAPSIGERFGKRSRFDATITDPCNLFFDADNPKSQAVQDRCIALGVPSDGSFEQLNSQISVITDGNLALKPETSDSFNISAAYSPAALQDKPWVDTFDFEAAFYDITINSPIAALDAQEQLNRCVIGNDDLACMGIERNSSGDISSFANQIQNTGSIATRGLDLTISYSSPRKPFGKLRATWQSSYLLKYDEEIQGIGGLIRIKEAGKVIGTPERAFPRFKSSLALGWARRNLDVQLTTRYIHSVTEPCVGFIDGLCSDRDPVDDTKSTNKLGVTVYNDIQVNWSPDFDHGLTITAGVNNLFDIEPPACFACSLNGFNPATYDVPGVFGYVSAAYHLQ